MAKYNLTGLSWQEIINRLINRQENITEIEVNGDANANAPVSLFIKQKGQRIEIPEVWKNSDDYTARIVELLELIDQNDPNNEFLAEGRIKLDTGETARVHVVLPPASDYPQVTIAKKSISLNTLDALRENGAFDQEIQRFLTMLVGSNCTIVFSGKTGAGKTTLLEAMTKLLPDSDRIGIVEDSQELQLKQPNVTYLHSTLWKPGMKEGSVATLSWCVQQLNRQRVDKIIIGETRGGEFADFVIAANSGSEGSMTTIHANNPKTALQKMSNFMVIGLPQPQRAANLSIAQSIDFIVQLGFDKQGRNKLLTIEHVSEVLSSDTSATVATAPIFEYDEKNDRWEFKKANLSTDAIREKFDSYGFDYQTFRKKDKRKPVDSLPQMPKFNIGKRP